jgi:hypothetical protein
MAALVDQCGRMNTFEAAEIPVKESRRMSAIGVVRSYGQPEAAPAVRHGEEMISYRLKFCM